MGTNLGKIVALNPSNGSIKWLQLLLGGITSTPTLAADGTLVVSTDTELIYKLNPSTGATVRQASVALPLPDGEVPSFAIAADGKVIVATGALLSGKVVALSPTLSTLWTVNLPGLPLHGVAIGPDGTTYVTTKQTLLSAKGLHAISKTGSLLWSVALPASPAAGPVVGPNNTLLIGADNGALFARNQQNGSQAWTYTVDQVIGHEDVGSPSLFIDGSIVFGSRNHRVYALNPNGSLRWKASTNGEVIGNPTIERSGLVYIGADDNRLRALDVKTGAVVWQYDAGAAIHSGVSVAPNGTVYFGSNGFQLFAVGSTPPPPDAPALPPRTSRDGLEPLGVTVVPVAGEQNCDPDEGSWVAVYGPDGLVSDAVWNPTPSSDPACAMTLCNANNVPLSPQPTAPDNAVFGSASATTGETCAAIAPQATCGVDRSQPYGATCTTAAECGAGKTCAEICLDDTCATLAHRCATTLLGCGGLPQEANCRDLNLCPSPLAVDRTENPIAGEDPPELPFDPQLNLLADTLPAPLAFTIGDQCVVGQDKHNFGKTLGRGKDTGSERWGVGYYGGLLYDAQNESHGLSAATMELFTQIDFGLDVTIFGHELKKIIGVFGRVGAGTCGAAAGFGLTLGGKDIDLGGYSLGSAIKTVTGLDEFKNSQKDCRQAAAELDEYANRLKKAMLDAVEINKQVVVAAKTALPRITSKLCRRTAEEFSAPIDITDNDGRRIRYADEVDGFRNGRCDPKEDSKCQPSFVDQWLGGDIANCDDPTFWHQNTGVQVAEAWINDYDLARQNYQAAYNKLLDKLPTIKGRVGLGSSSDDEWDKRSFNKDPWVSGGVNTQQDQTPQTLASSGTFVDGQPSYARDGNVTRYAMYEVGVTFPIGPFSVVLAIEPSGYWGIGATLDYQVFNAVGGNAEPTAMAAINYVPRAGLDVIAYAGIGIGGNFASMTIGIEGILTLVEFRTPLAIGLGVVRPEQPDPRPIHPDLLPAQPLWYGKVQNEWKLEFLAGAGLDVDILKGRINIAARVKFWKYKKTFSKKIADFSIIPTAHYNWVGTVHTPSFTPLDLGWTRPEVTYPQLPAADIPTLVFPLGNGLNETDNYTGGTLGYTTSCLPPPVHPI